MGVVLTDRGSGGVPARQWRVRGELFVVDAALLVTGLAVATYLRYDFAFRTDSWARTGILLGFGTGLLVVLGRSAGLYTGRWLAGSFEEAPFLAMTAFGVTFGLVPLDILLGHPLPAGAVLAAGPMLLGAMMGTRAAHRMAVRRLGDRGSPRGRVVVFGAGAGGYDVIGAMVRDRRRTFEPTALLDDDPAKANLHLCGIPVCGTRSDLAQVARRTGSDTLLIAVPSATSALVADLTERATAAGLSVRVLPPVGELFRKSPGVGDIRPVSFTDLLGRDEVDVDVDAIAGYLTGCRVLVTGAGGSIGAELCRQIRRYDPEVMVMLDRDESALHELQLSLDGRALLDSPALVVADIRDRARIAAVMEQHRPQVVFHAAALKHLPLLQMHPNEAVKTNVFGTDNVLSAGMEAGVSRFVNISTDKAADPISVLGYSKRITERLTASYQILAADSPDVRFLSVRFGNVLGSRGSVLTAFRRQIAAGNPVTVTHPEVTRYFMTIEEAVRLVIEAGAVGTGGQLLVLDMGDPVRIIDVARQLIAESGRDVDVVFTGLRPGEKLTEQLLGSGEQVGPAIHPKIRQVLVPALSPLDLTEFEFDVMNGEQESVIERLQATATGAIRMPPEEVPVLPITSFRARGPAEREAGGR
jgi:FlaA1/EpsC-like NDP-sugar epimerase